MNTSPRCPCCEHSDTASLGELPKTIWFAGAPTDTPLAGGKLFRCNRCFLKFRYPLLTDDTYRILYNSAPTSMWSNEIMRRDWDQIIRYFRDESPRGGRILDVGCGTGGLLARLDGRFEKHGVEIRDSARAIAAGIGLTIWPTLEEVPASLRFDYIIVVDVIEHIRNPARFMKVLIERLRPDGVMIITTGDADNFWWNLFGANWWYCFHPEHIAFISRRWLDHHAREQGAQVMHTHTFSYRRLPPGRLLLSVMLATLYGVFPRVYAWSMRTAKRLLNRPGDIPMYGSGVSADHLFAVLKSTVRR